MTLFLLSQLPWAAVLVYVLHVHARDVEARDDAWRKERRDLLNRIQAPVAAQKQAEIEIPRIDPMEQPYVPFDDDEAFHEARKVTVDG